jgi:hypothetical protein
LETVLLGNDPEQAALAIEDLGRTVGRQHATTLHRRAEHNSALAEFGAVDITTGGPVETNGPRR